MSESNKTYRIRTNVGSDNNGPINLDVNLLQDYDIFEILSLKIDTESLYHLHTSKYGCLVGRVLANGGVGIPNAKISVFISADNFDLNDPIFNYIYPYTTTKTKNKDNIRYNLLTDQKLDACHQDIGTFPNKRLVLDDDNYLEIFDKYYKFTTATNGSGDYMLFGLPVGNNIIHTDLDLSDIGILSQKPRDLFYKGYSATQFENASQFKKDTNLDNLTQVFSQDLSIYVSPFWGDESENADQIKITRSDVDINYKFEPTCIFIGSIVSDEKSNAISKNCIPSERMGKMDRLTTGRGTIEMIRKTLADNTESIAIQGNELIDGNGTWCYQIPMNLDYVKTDEYGNLVPTNDTDNGIPTRTRVRFRVSLADYESDYESTHLVKVLVPNNPKVTKDKDNNNTLVYDYEFGSSTADESYRDLFWNNVYTVKQYVPRIQKGNRQRNKNFTGFKAVNVNGANNPIPYNNMRINLTFLFVFQCLIFKSLVLIVKILNRILYAFDGFKSVSSNEAYLGYITLDGGMCPNLEGNYIAPGARETKNNEIVKHTYSMLKGDGEEVYKDEDNDVIITNDGSVAAYDPKSADGKNGNYIENEQGKTTDVLSDTFINDEDEQESLKIYNNEDYFIKCVELQFAMEYEVIQFDFYNDWINGMLYIPRWFAEARKNKDGMVYCGESFNFNRRLVQQCALGYGLNNGSFELRSNKGCSSNGQQRCHKKGGRKYVNIFGSTNHGIVERLKTSKGHYAYYLRPSEMVGKKKANLFATDLVLMGSVTDCNTYGIPKVTGYSSSTYIMPPPTGEIISDSQEIEFNSDDRFLVVKFKAKYGSNPNYPNSTIVVVTDNNFSVVESDKIQIEINNEIKTYDILNVKDSLLKVIKGEFRIKGNVSDEFKQGKKIKLLRKYPLYQFNKVPLIGKDENDEHPYPELAGIDWGYNPYKTDENDDTTIISNQVAGHFLEIGCTFSLSNIKSCVNLSRICELGSEISQSHYYEASDNFVRPAGIIGKREINNEGIRTTFATLNSNFLNTGVDVRTGYLRYNLKGYVPNTFMGDLATKLKNEQDADFSDLRKNPYSYVEGESKSYKAFRFGTTDFSALNNSFLVVQKRGNRNDYYMPVFENSFYFYFGLKNGSTAIDRLYTEYYAECSRDDENGNEASLELTSSDLITYYTQNNTEVTKTRGRINFVVNGLGHVEKKMIKVEYNLSGDWKTVVLDGVPQKIVNQTYVTGINMTNNYIEVIKDGRYRVTFNNKTLDIRVSGEVVVEKNSFTVQSADDMAQGL